MIADKSIDIKISRVNIDYYKEIGYSIVLGNTYKIKCCDVIKTVANKIFVICENCNIEKDIKSQNYHNQLKKSGYYLCSNCSYIKVKQTNLDRYGTECPLQNKEVNEKSKNTLLEVYGVDNISKLDSIKEDRKENFRSNNFKDKAKKTWLDKYGVDNPSKSIYIKVKKEENTFKNYGVVNPSQSPELFEKSQISGKRIKEHSCGLMYRGTYEKDFLDYCVSENIEVEKGITIKYDFLGMEKYYHSDFYLPKLNLVCEIKSSYYYSLYKDKNICKKEGTIKLGYNFLFIIDKNYDELKNSL